MCVAPRHDPALPVPSLQDTPCDHPPGRDDLHPLVPLSLRKVADLLHKPGVDSWHFQTAPDQIPSRTRDFPPLAFYLLRRRNLGQIRPDGQTGNLPCALLCCSQRVLRNAHGALLFAISTSRKTTPQTGPSSTPIRGPIQCRPTTASPGNPQNKRRKPQPCHLHETRNINHRRVSSPANSRVTSQWISTPIH